MPQGLREEHNDVASFIYAVIGVAYAVLLAFVVIAVWEDYETAKNTTESEANELAGSTSSPTGSPIPSGRVSRIWPARTPMSS